MSAPVISGRNTSPVLQLCEHVFDEVALEAFEGLGRRARLAVGLARKLGERAEKEREAERRRKELARQAEVKRQQEERDRQRHLAREIEEPTFRRSWGMSRGPDMGF
jgi:hypothetical protein